MGLRALRRWRPRGLKPGSIWGTLFAALKALRHPRALRGAEAPLFHGAACGGDPRPGIYIPWG